MDKKYQSVITGLLLGDGGLDVLTSGTVRLCVRQRSDRKEYVDMLYEELKGLVRTSPKLIKSYDKRTDTTCFRYGFKTRVNPQFLEYRRIFYDEVGKKKIPEQIANLLDRKALAIWFMDDGSYKNDSKGLFLNTNAFSKEDQDRLRYALKEKFQIETKLHRLRQWYRIYIPARQAIRFRQLVRNYIVPSMQYKLP